MHAPAVVSVVPPSCCRRRQHPSCACRGCADHGAAATSPVGAGGQCRYARDGTAGSEPAAGVERQFASIQPPPRAEFSLRRSGACRGSKLRCGRQIVRGRDWRRRQPHPHPPPPEFQLERTAARGLSAAGCRPTAARAVCAGRAASGLDAPSFVARRRLLRLGSVGLICVLSERAAGYGRRATAFPLLAGSAPRR